MVIVAEIPTYPYDKEIRTIRNLHVLVKNRFNRKKLYKYIDRIVTFSLDDTIFGIKTIKITNGIDIDSVPIVSHTSNDNSIRLISVANMAFWHGLDRLILGIASYYKKNNNRKIILDIVGYGEDYERISNMIKENDLNEYIIMHGYQTGSNLDKIFINADIAVSSLADHRKGLNIISALKAHEYLARGLPMIASAKIDVLPDDYKYCLYIPCDESPVDVIELINFYDSIYNNNDKKKINFQIHNFAITHCDMKNTFRPVLDYIADKTNLKLDK